MCFIIAAHLPSGFAASVCMEPSKFPRPCSTARLTGCACSHTDQYCPVESSANMLIVDVRFYTVSVQGVIKT